MGRRGLTAAVPAVGVAPLASCPLRATVLEGAEAVDRERGVVVRQPFPVRCTTL